MQCAVDQIASVTGARLVCGDGGKGVVGVSTDTRALHPGALFLALRGPNFDGNRYARIAAERGAGALLLREDDAARGAIAELASDVPALLHADPRRALGDLASWHRGHLSAPVVGITGSCGKTTTKNMLMELLSSARSTVASPSSFNNDVGVPHTLLLADPATEALVVEMGTSGPGEIAALCAIARPNAGIITNIGPSHLEGLGSIEGVAKEKGELAAALPADGFLVLDASDRFTPLFKVNCSARAITFSVEGEGDLNATDIRFDSAGSRFRLDGREISSPLLGRHNIQNLMAALAACRGLGLSLDDVLPAVARLRDGRQRSQRLEFGEVLVVDDSYNANPASAEAAVQLLTDFRDRERRVLVLGDMLELGPRAAELHHRVGFVAAEAKLDLLVVVGELARASAAGALEGGLDASRVVHLHSSEAAAAEVPDRVRAGDVVLVKASRAMGLESVVDALRGRFGRSEA